MKKNCKICFKKIKIEEAIDEAFCTFHCKCSKYAIKYFGNKWLEEYFI